MTDRRSLDGPLDVDVPEAPGEGPRCPVCREPPHQCNCLEDHADTQRSLYRFGGGGRVSVLRVRDFTSQEERLSVVIILGDSTSHRQVVEAMKHATQWRDAVLNHQGPQLELHLQSFLDELASYHDARVSQADLVERINRSFEAYIRWEHEAWKHGTPDDEDYHDGIQEFMEQHRSLPFDDESKLLFVDIGRVGIPSWSVMALAIIQLFFTKTREAHDAVEAALEELRGGGDPFDVGGEWPISRDALWDKLKGWKKGKTHRAVKSARGKDRSLN